MKQKAMIDAIATIEEVDVDAVVPSAYNPRRISKEAREGLAASMERFGMVSLLVVNRRNMRVVAGHQRLEILRSQGAGKVLAVMVDLDEAREKAMNVTLNNEHIMGQWTAAVADKLRLLRESDADGFLALRLAELQKKVGEVDSVIDEKIREKEVDETLPTTHKCPGCSYEW